MKTRYKTTVGEINEDVLFYTAGRDIELDQALIEYDCVGSAAHVRMLSDMRIDPPLFTKEETSQVLHELLDIMRHSRTGRFEITLQDQDVHMAVERILTSKLGDLGRKIHTARSRNDQVAVDLRLYAKQQIIDTMDETASLANVLVDFSRKYSDVPMPGRTHMQPAMPSSVGLWAGAQAESLLDDLVGLINAYELNDQCPLGSAAGYGVPMPVDRELVSDLLGFSRPIHNVLHAAASRGKMESVVLSAMSQVMLSLSRTAQDLMLFTMPELHYFELPSELCTGSSIMPQKKNPDVLELVRAKASRVLAHHVAVYDIVKGSPSGYNRDLQEAKEPFMEGISITRASVMVMSQMIKGLKVNTDALLKGFTPDVFATDRAIELVGRGMPFRDAYQHVKDHLDELEQIDPVESISKKSYYGMPGGMDFNAISDRLKNASDFAGEKRKSFHAAIGSLLDVPYPELE